MFEFNTSAALVAVCAALPPLAVAAFFAVRSRFQTFWEGVGSLITIYAIFLFGRPLTYIVVRKSLLSGESPLFDKLIASRTGAAIYYIFSNLVFILQWIIWSQLIVFAGKLISTRVLPFN
jgi:hypothetical protein